MTSRPGPIPIVFVEATNEVGYGLTGNLAHSAGDATGITNSYPAHKHEASLAPVPIVNLAAK
jgi:ABC-type uncharacterized transport system substrate-binding protein